MSISIIEVGPRDGLQNVKEPLSFDQKRALIQYLISKGFADIEAGAFVRPDRIPQMADSEKLAEVFESEHATLWYLVPNMKGLERALKLGVTQIAFFTAASDTFNQKNIGKTTDESVDEILRCMSEIRDQAYNFVRIWRDKPVNVIDVKIRLYISTILHCPYEGKVDSKKVLTILERFEKSEISQISLGDTIGRGQPAEWKKLLREISCYNSELIPAQKMAMHCHDTQGKALRCVASGLEEGVTAFDSSIGGLGGCPFAPGAPGNLATEDLVDFLEREGLKPPVKVADLLDAFAKERTGVLCSKARLFSMAP